MKRVFPSRRSCIRLLSVAVLLVVGLLSRHPERLPTEAVVRRVVDGDTIQLTSGQLVRYIGINTPELRRREGGGHWIVDPEPFAQEAAQANQHLVEHKTVQLEYDVQPRDRYGRLLAYVYVDGRMVNAKLLEEGYAELLTIPPDVRYAATFRRLLAEAKRARRGMWKSSSARPREAGRSR